MSKRLSLTSLLVFAFIVGLLFTANSGHAVAVSEPTNLGFETGDLDGWKKNADGGVRVITWPDTWRTLSAPDGASFLRINSSPYGERSVYQTFDWAGGTISGWYASLKATAFVKIFDADNDLIAQFALTSGKKNSGWQTWNWGLDAGKYTLVFAVTGKDTGGAAFDVKTVGAPVPLPTSAYLLGAGLIGLYGIRRKFWKKTGKA